MLAIDLGGTRVKAALVRDGAAGPVSVRTHLASQVAPALELVASLIDELAPGGVEDVGLCVPGLVDAGGRVVSLPGKLAGIVGIDLCSWLSARTGGRAVVVNDALAYGLGEARELPGRIVVVTVGTGVGTAVIEDGAPLGRGTTGGGQLAGQLPLTADGPLDTSGRPGTIEAWCRAGQLLEQVRAAGCPADDVAAALAAAGAGDPSAVNGLSAYRGWLARGVAALCLAYAPDTVILGGGPVRGDGLLVDGLQELVRPLLWSNQDVVVRAGRHGDAAALLGLAALAQRRQR